MGKQSTILFTDTLLATAGFVVALLNAMRTHRFAGEELAHTKTDVIDALGIARFAAEKGPPPAHLPDFGSERKPRKLHWWFVSK